MARFPFIKGTCRGGAATTSRPLGYNAQKGPSGLPAMGRVSPKPCGAPPVADSNASRSAPGDLAEQLLLHTPKALGLEMLQRASSRTYQPPHNLYVVGSCELYDPKASSLWTIDRRSTSGCPFASVKSPLMGRHLHRTISPSMGLERRLPDGLLVSCQHQNLGRRYLNTGTQPASWNTLAPTKTDVPIGQDSTKRIWRRSRAIGAARSICRTTRRHNHCVCS